MSWAAPFVSTRPSVALQGLDAIHAIGRAAIDMPTSLVQQMATSLDSAVEEFFLGLSPQLLIPCAGPAADRAGSDITNRMDDGAGPLQEQAELTKGSAASWAESLDPKARDQQRQSQGRRRCSLPDARSRQQSWSQQHPSAVCTNGSSHVDDEWEELIGSDCAPVSACTKPPEAPVTPQRTPSLSMASKGAGVRSNWLDPGLSVIVLP